MPRTSEHLRQLMTQSLLAWRLAGEVCGASDGAILVSCDNYEICIAPAPPGVPFRWTVTIDGRRRAAISVIAVLRQVRTALDPGYAAMRVRVAMVPLVPS
jgi:hypothetical protein